MSAKKAKKPTKPTATQEEKIQALINSIPKAEAGTRLSDDDRNTLFNLLASLDALDAILASSNESITIQADSLRCLIRAHARMLQEVVSSK